MFGAYRVDIVAKGYNIIQTNIGFYDMEPAWYVVVIGWTLEVIFLAVEICFHLLLKKRHWRAPRCANNKAVHESLLLPRATC